MGFAGEEMAMAVAEKAVVEMAAAMETVWCNALGPRTHRQLGSRLGRDPQHLQPYRPRSNYRMFL